MTVAQMNTARLVGWLCIMRLNLEGRGAASRFHLPGHLRAEMVGRGWLVEAGGPFELTAVGRVITDLEAPEWGIDPIA